MKITELLKTLDQIRSLKERMKQGDAGGEFEAVTKDAIATLEESERKLKAAIRDLVAERKIDEVQEVYGVFSAGGGEVEFYGVYASEEAAVQAMIEIALQWGRDFRLNDLTLETMSNGKWKAQKCVSPIALQDFVGAQNDVAGELPPPVPPPNPPAPWMWTR